MSQLEKKIEQKPDSPEKQALEQQQRLEARRVAEIRQNAEKQELDRNIEYRVESGQLAPEFFEMRAYHRSAPGIPDREIGNISVTHETVDGKTASRIDDVEVESPYRKKGIGRELLRQAEADARAKGSTEIRGEITPTDAPDQISQANLERFYRRCGYQVEWHKDAQGLVRGNVYKKV